MIKFKAKNINYQIPSSWSEVTYSQWKRLIDTDNDLEIISILSGMEIDIVTRLDDKSLYNISRLLSFVGVELDVKKYEAPETLTIKLNHKDIRIDLIKDIKEKTFGQKIYLQELLKEYNDDIFSCMIDIILIYSQPQIDNSDFNIDRIEELRYSFEDLFLVDLYSTAMSYINQLNQIISSEVKTLNVEPTHEQKLAGIDMFDKFGVMNTVRALSGNDILKIDEVLKVEYNVAFTFMAMSKTQNDYADNYREIMNRK